MTRLSHIRMVLILAVGIAATSFALAAGIAHNPLTRDSRDHHEAAAPATNDAQHDHRDEALRDIYAYAGHQLGNFHARPGTFHGASQSSGDWDLHWLDVEHDGHDVRIMHLAQKHHPHHRYMSMWASGSEQPTAWYLVR